MSDQPRAIIHLDLDAFYAAVEILEDPDLCKEMVNHNYEMGKKHYSYSVLTRKLMNLVFDCLGV